MLLMFAWGGLSYDDLMLLWEKQRFKHGGVWYVLLTILFLGWICSTFQEFLSLIIYFIFLFSIHAWVLFFYDICRFLTSLTWHLTFIEHNLTYHGAPLSCHDCGMREEKRTLSQWSPRLARGKHHGSWWPCNSHLFVMPRVCDWECSRFILKRRLSVQ